LGLSAEPRTGKVVEKVELKARIHTRSIGEEEKEATECISVKVPGGVRFSVSKSKGGALDMGQTPRGKHTHYGS